MLLFAFVAKSDDLRWLLVAAGACEGKLEKNSRKKGRNKTKTTIYRYPGEEDLQMHEKYSYVSKYIVIKALQFLA